MSDSIFPLFGPCEKCGSYNLKLKSRWAALHQRVSCSISCLGCRYRVSSAKRDRLRDAELDAFGAWSWRPGLWLERDGKVVSW